MSQPKHFDYLDGWRGLAIFFLLLGHFFPVPGLNFGAAGVNLFFVLSGLLMGRLLFIQEVPITQFYLRRIARIFPAVLVFVALIVLAYLVLGKPVAWADVAAASLLINNYVLGGLAAKAMPFGHFWSLCVEEHSYILLSLLAIAARHRVAHAGLLVPAIACIAGATAVYYGFHYQGLQLWKMGMHTEAAALGIFASAALLLTLDGKRVPALPGLTVPALLCLGVMLHWWSVYPPLKMVGGVLVFALAVNLLPAAPGWVHAALSFKPLRQLGLWSFSIYIWQQPFYLLTRHHGWPAPLAMLAGVACGVASYYLVERPARSWLNRRWEPRSKPSLQVGASAA